MTWKDSIVPLLLSRYPNLTPEQLNEARAYAYGGCVIQDIGYYPFGNASLSNLTHYVRTGDFVVNLFRNAQNADELAFAVGALSHYIGDSIGHALATNHAVPVEFPKLGVKYGPTVNYAEGKHEHVQTEFAFDIDEIAHRRLAPVRFLRHIGLKVPVRQLALAYYQTYGLTEDFTKKKGSRINVRGYRFAVHTFIPRVAYAVTVQHRKHEPADPNTPEFQEIEKEVAATSAENNWGEYRSKAGFGTYTLAGLLYILPKVGAIKMASVKGPTEATEAEYMHSVLLSATILRRTAARFTPPATGHAAGDPATPPPAVLLSLIAATQIQICLVAFGRSEAPAAESRQPGHGARCAAGRLSTERTRLTRYAAASSCAGAESGNSAGNQARHPGILRRSGGADRDEEERGQVETAAGRSCSACEHADEY